MATKRLTKKEITAQAIAAESKYQRAAAAWVCSRSSEKLDQVYGVTFTMDEGYQSCGHCDPYGSFDTGPSLNISYYQNGNYREMYWPDISAGQFIEECVAFLD